MVHRNIHDISIPFYVYKKQKPLKTIKRNLAFDSETCEGRAFLIYNSDGEGVNDYDNFKQPDAKQPEDKLYGLLTYLNNRKFKNTVNWYYNLTYDQNAILKYLNFKERKLIATYNEVDYKDFRIRIIPNKELKISKIRDDKALDSTFFYDLAQFYNFKPLKELAKQTEYNKVYVDDISHVNIDKYYSDDEYYKLWNDRCLIDCKITVDMADKLTNNINKIVGVNSYKSKASIARRYILENITRNLKMPDVKIIDCALKAFHAGHIETCALGKFDNIHNADLNSAYPHQIANLYETNAGYTHNKEYVPDTAYSFYLVTVDYYDADLSPVWYLKSDANYHVTGKCDVWITQGEYEYFINNGYPIEIKDAYHIRKTRFTEKPFEYLVKDLYEERLKAKDNKDEIEKVYKVILNSIYGVTLNAVNNFERVDYETDIYEPIDGKLIFYAEKFTAGNMYNPVYGAYITANTRMKLFNDFNKVLDSIVAINTDGVYSTEKVNLPISKKLGDYSYKKLESYISMGSGRYFIGDSDGFNDDESRFRGVPLKPSAIDSKMRNNLNKSSIEIVKDKPIKLKESVKNSNYYYTSFMKFPIQDYVHRDEFNVFNRVTKEIRFENNRRYWFESIGDISEIYDNQFYSRPFNVNEIAATC